MLAWDEGGAAPPAPRVLHAFELPSGAGDFGGAGVAPHRTGEGATWSADAWDGGGRLELELPAELGAFDGVLVRGSFEGAHRLQLDLHWQDRERRLARDANVLDGATVDWLLAHPDGVELRAASATLIVEGPRCRIDSIAFVELAPEARLPEPGHERGVALSGDVRGAVGLPPGRAFAAELRPHRSGDTLELAVGRWPEQPGDAEPAALLVDLETPQGTVQRSFELDGTSRWRAVSLPLTGMLTGTRRMRLHAQGPQGAPLALADLWLGQRSATAPSVLLITSDAAAPGAAAEALLVRGVSFEDCQAATGDAAFDRAALATGLSPRDTGRPDDVARAVTTARKLAEAFRAAGFRTFGALGARPPGSEEGHWCAGFDRLEFAEDVAAAAQARRRLLDWIEEAEGQPVFAWVHLHDPDAGLDELLEVARLGEGVVAFVGARASQRGLPLPESLRVPLWLAWPGAPQRRSVSAPVELVDLGRTLLALADVDAGGFPGRDLRAELDAGPDARRPRFALGGAGAYASVTLGDEVLVLQLDAAGRVGLDLGLHGCALFDRVGDPDGRHDLSRERAQRARALRGLLLEWLALAEAARPRGPEADSLRAWIDSECACEACATWR